MRFGALCCCLFAGSPAWATTAAIYYDSGYDPVSAAAVALGITPYAAQADPQQFVAWVPYADIVIVNTEYSYLSPALLSAVGAAAAQGRPIIFGFWDLDANPALMAGLGVASATDYLVPAPLYAAEGAPDFFRGIGGTLVPSGDGVYDNGDWLTMASGDVVGHAAGNASVIGLNGQIIVNGWMPIDFQGRDGDGDGMEDVQEVFQAELQYLTGRYPLDLRTSGEGRSCPGPWVYTFEQFSPGGRLAVFTSRQLGNERLRAGPCPGLTLGLGGSPAVAAILPIDPTGSYRTTVTLPAGSCGQYLQAVDVDTCQVSNPVFNGP